MKRTSILFFTVIFALSLNSCQGGTKTAELKVTITSWSGFREDYNPKVTEKIYTVAKGDTLDLGGICELAADIKSISKDKVVIKTNTPMSDYAGGTINLKTDKTRFHILRDKELKLITPTMDQGNIYYFEIVSVNG